MDGRALPDRASRPGQTLSRKAFGRYLPHLGPLYLHSSFSLKKAGALGGQMLVHYNWGHSRSGTPGSEAFTCTTVTLPFGEMA